MRKGGYNTLQEIETHTSAALGRESARQFAPLIAPVGGAGAPWLLGDQGKTVDGTTMEARAHRRKARRGVEAGALPGKALGVYEPASGVVRDGLPGEEGHAQERSLCPAGQRTGQAGDRGMAARTFCPREFLCAIAARGAACVIRQHRGVPWEMVSPLPPLGRGETGPIAAPRGRVVEAQDGVHGERRLRIKRNPPTRDGATWLDIVTHGPARPVAGKRGARLEHKRGPLAIAFPSWAAYCQSAIKT